MNQSLRLALVSGAPFAIIMFVLAEPLCLLLYNNAEISDMLKIMAPFALFLYVQSRFKRLASTGPSRPGITEYVIRGDHQNEPHCVFGIQSRLWHKGAVIAIIVNSIAVTILHGFSLSRLIGFRFRLLDYVKIGAVMIIMGACVLYGYKHLPFRPRHGCNFGPPSRWYSGLFHHDFMTKLVTPRDLERVPVIGAWFNKFSRR